GLHGRKSRVAHEFDRHTELRRKLAAEINAHAGKLTCVGVQAAVVAVAVVDADPKDAGGSQLGDCCVSRGRLRLDGLGQQAQEGEDRETQPHGLVATSRTSLEGYSPPHSLKSLKLLTAFVPGCPA